MKKLSYILLLTVIILTSCEDPFKDQLFVTESKDQLTLTNAAYLEKRSQEFSLWIDLLHYADLYNAINDASTQTTIFCPDNDAMNAFLKFKNISKVDELDYNYARELVKAHILKGSLTEANFMVYVSEGQIKTPTVFGMYLSASYGYTNTELDDVDLVNSKPQDTLSIYVNNQASVKEMARQTVNGMVYVTGGVIRPMSENIVQKLIDFGDYKVFVEAVKATGLDKMLSTVTDTVYELGGGYTVNHINFTCLAVPDSVYKLNGITSLADLGSKLSATGNFKDSTNALFKYIKYHIIEKIQKKSDLFTFDEPGQVRIFDTSLKNQVFTTEQVEGQSILNKNIKFVRSDIQARNGIIHKIDGIMPVWEPEPMTVIWDFCNSKDIISIANAYGAANSLGDLFSMLPPGKEYQVDLSLDKINGNFGNISSFIYKEASTKTSYNTWRKVGFMKCRYLNAQNPTVNTYGAYMDNLFILNLGYTGWIEMKTPTIIKGKYKVEFYYAGTAALQAYYSTGSMVRFTLDDNVKSLYVWKGLDTKAGSHIHGDVLFDEVVFDASKTHDFRAVMMDIKASTNSPYRQMWDYIKFVPIEN